MKQFKLVFAALFLISPLTLRAALIVDNSPDTTGAVTITANFGNTFPGQYFADQFTIANDVTITGGAIFSVSNFGVIGDAVKFTIFSDIAGAPSTTPLWFISTTIDSIDSVLTTTDASLTRKHASVTPFALAAGSYWFGMWGDGNQIAQASGTYDDGSYYAGLDANPDLEFGSFALGDTFFTLEGNSISVPVPGTLALLGLGLAGIGFTNRKKPR